jgi:hypothetical protein
MDTYISKVSVRALARCLALHSVKGIRPRQMRQLYKAYIVPTMDYAASAWFRPDKWGTERLLNRLGQVQRVGARIILRAFRQVSLEVLEAEACLETTTHRLTSRTARHTGKLLAADQSNPARVVLLIKNKSDRHCSPLQLTLRRYEKHLQSTGLTPITPDPAWIQAP